MRTGSTGSGRATGGRRSHRLEARVTADEKEILIAASEITGRGLSEFVVSAAVNAAREELRRRKTLELSVEDAAAFVDALMRPPPPSEALVRAGRRYRKEGGASSAPPA